MINLNPNDFTTIPVDHSPFWRRTYSHRKCHYSGIRITITGTLKYNNVIFCVWERNIRNCFSNRGHMYAIWPTMSSKLPDVIFLLKLIRLFKLLFNGDIQMTKKHYYGYIKNLTERKEKSYGKRNEHPGTVTPRLRTS